MDDTEICQLAVESDPLVKCVQWWWKKGPLLVSWRLQTLQFPNVTQYRRGVRPHSFCEQGLLGFFGLITRSLLFLRPINHDHDMLTKQ